MNRVFAFFLAWLPLAVSAQTDTLRLSLDDCIAMARRQSIDAAVALGELRSAYWQWRSYKADLLPEVSLSGTLPSYNKRYSSYQQADGGLSFVRNDYLGLDGAVNITQKLWPTGGTLSVESSLDYLHQSGSGGTGNQFMSLPVAVTLSQPLFSVNHLKWDRRIEPLRYREAQARFLTETEQVAMQAISLYFNLLLAGERVNIARQNLQTAEKLYEVALAKREMGTISQNDVLQLRLDVLTARSALTNSESSRKASQFALRSFLDVEADIEPSVPENVPQMLLNYDDVLNHALRNNAQATTMRRRQMEADYAVASARANRQSINLYAQVGYTGTADNMRGAYRDLLSNEVVQVGITVPLLDWGKRKGQRRMAESNREIVQGHANRHRTSARTSSSSPNSSTIRPSNSASPVRPTPSPAAATTPTLRRSRSAASPPSSSLMRKSPRIRPARTASSSSSTTGTITISSAPSPSGTSSAAVTSVQT